MARYTMTINDGIELCRAVHPHTAIPVHYEGCSHFRQGRTSIERVIATAPLDVPNPFRLLPIGSSEEIGV